MARFCGVFSPINPSLMHRNDIRAMLDGYIRHTPQVESSFYDDNAGFGLAVLTDADSPGPNWAERADAVAAFSGFIATAPNEVEEQGSRAASLLVDTLMAGQSPEDLAGEFAIALWSKQHQTLRLLNDPFGKGPLFYIHDEASGLIAFASEPKSLLNHPIAKREVDNAGLGFYLRTRHISPPFTAYRGMKRLYFGEQLTISATSGVQSEIYWKYPAITDQNRDLDSWSEEVSLRFRKALENLVAGHEKVGLMLGAGIDSSLIYGLLKKYQPDVQVVPITGTYPTGGAHKYVNLDLPYARQLAAHWGDELVEVTISLPLLSTYIEPALRQVDQPFVAIGNMASMLAMTDAAADAGANLLLTGQGAEENFGMMYWQKVLDERADGRLQTYDEIVEYHSEAERFSAERQQRLFLDPPATIDADFVTAYQGLLESLPSRDPYDVALYAIRQVARREHINLLTTATMAMRRGRLNNLFCDWHTVSFAAQIPSRFKGSEDFSFQRALILHQHRDLIPQFVFERGKRGLPGLEFNNGEFPNLEKRLLSREVVEAQGIFNPDYFARVLSKKGLRKSLLMAQVWLDLHVFQTEETSELIEADRRLAAM